jgi:hypothetical protein
MAWIKTCPVCNGPVDKVGGTGWAKDFYECTTAQRQTCDRFFTADEVAVSR